MSTLEIVLIVYIVVSQIFTMVAVSFSTKKHRNIIMALFFIANPFGMTTAMIIIHIDDKKREKELEEMK